MKMYISNHISHRKVVKNRYKIKYFNLGVAVVHGVQIEVEIAKSFFLHEIKNYISLKRGSIFQVSGLV